MYWGIRLLLRYGEDEGLGMRREAGGPGCDDIEFDLSDNDALLMNRLLICYRFIQLQIHLAPDPPRAKFTQIQIYPYPSRSIQVHISVQFRFSLLYPSNSMFPLDLRSFTISQTKKSHKQKTINPPLSTGVRGSSRFSLNISSYHQSFSPSIRD
jgi:hypothetical protein